MKLPIPSFKDWLNAFWLLFLVGVWIWVGKIIFLSISFIGLLTNNLWIGLVGLLFAAFIFPITLPTYLHYIFWGKRNSKFPVWIATVPSWKEGLWQWFIAFTAFFGVLFFIGIIVLFILGLVFGLGFLASSLINQFHGEDYAKEFIHGFFNGFFRSLSMEEFLQRLSPFFGILWLLIASEMMAWKRKIANPNTKKTANKD
jgi:hypothetical protein